jgi:hypothetical protein
MPPVVSALLAFFGSLFQSRQAMHLKILALQHQVAVYQQSVHRPRLQPSDRLFWSWLSLVWSGWQDALRFVQPGTVIACQKRRFRDHWRRLSHQGKPGRPVIAKEIRALIRHMSQANPNPCQGAGRPRFLCGADRDLQGAVCPAHPCPSPAPRRACQRHRAPHGRVDRPASGPGIPMG